MSKVPRKQIFLIFNFQKLFKQRHNVQGNSSKVTWRLTCVELKCFSC